MRIFLYFVGACLALSSGLRADPPLAYGKEVIVSEKEYEEYLESLPPDQRNPQAGRSHLKLLAVGDLAGRKVKLDGSDLKRIAEMEGKMKKTIADVIRSFKYQILFEKLARQKPLVRFPGPCITAKLISPKKGAEKKPEEVVRLLNEGGALPSSYSETTLSDITKKDLPQSMARVFDLRVGESEIFKTKGAGGEEIPVILSVKKKDESIGKEEEKRRSDEENMNRTLHELSIEADKLYKFGVPASGKEKKK